MKTSAPLLGVVCRSIPSRVEMNDCKQSPLTSFRFSDYPHYSLNTILYSVRICNGSSCPYSDEVGLRLIRNSASCSHAGRYRTASTHATAVRERRVRLYTQQRFVSALLFIAKNHSFHGEKPPNFPSLFLGWIYIYVIYLVYLI